MLPCHKRRRQIFTFVQSGQSRCTLIYPSRPHLLNTHNIYFSIFCLQGSTFLCLPLAWHQRHLNFNNNTSGYMEPVRVYAGKHIAWAQLSCKWQVQQKDKAPPCSIYEQFLGRWCWVLFYLLAGLRILTYITFVWQQASSGECPLISKSVLFS